MNKARFLRWPASTQKTNVWPSPYAWHKSVGEVECLGLFEQSNTANVQCIETWVSNVNARFCGTCSTTVSAAVETPCYHKYNGSSTCDHMMFPRYCIRTEFWHSCTKVPGVLLVLLQYWNTAQVLDSRKAYEIPGLVHSGYETKLHSSKMIKSMKRREEQATQTHNSPENNNNDVTEQDGGDKKEAFRRREVTREWVVWWQVVCMFWSHVNKQTRSLNEPSCNAISTLIYCMQSKYHTLASTTWV